MQWLSWCLLGSLVSGGELRLWIDKFPQYCSSKICIALGIRSHLEMIAATVGHAGCNPSRLGQFKPVLGNRVGPTNKVRGRLYGGSLQNNHSIQKTQGPRVWIGRKGQYRSWTQNLMCARKASTTRPRSVLIEIIIPAYRKILCRTGGGFSSFCCRNKTLTKSHLGRKELIDLHF